MFNWTITRPSWAGTSNHRLFLCLLLSAAAHGVLFESHLLGGAPAGPTAAAPQRLLAHLNHAPTEHNPAHTESDTQTAPVADEQAAAKSAPPTQEKAPPAHSAAVVNGMVQGAWYYPARYLHQRTRPLTALQIEPPPLTQNLEGVVRILLFVNERGGVDSYRIVASSPGDIFEKSVVDAFARIVYEPGLIAGQAVKSQLLIEVAFRKDGSIGSEVISHE